MLCRRMSVSLGRRGRGDLGRGRVWDEKEEQREYRREYEIFEDVFSD